VVVVVVIAQQVVSYRQLSRLRKSMAGLSHRSCGDVCSQHDGMKLHRNIYITCKTGDDIRNLHGDGGGENPWEIHGTVF